MERISWSQIQTWTSCPYKWKLNYIYKLREFSDSIYTVYGKALHTVLQNYITTMYTVSIKAADKIDMSASIVEELRKEYGKAVSAAKGKHFSTQSELTEFCIQGSKALEWFKKKRSNYFFKKNWELLGIEMEINSVYRNLDVLGYLDVVLRNTETGKIKIIDIKTSTRGWKKEKSDPMKRGQLLFYKKFIAEKYDVPFDDIEIEFFIVKRLVFENSDFPVRYVQIFEPPSGNISMNKMKKQLDIFIDECFTKEGEYNTEGEYKKLGLINNCIWCEYANRPDMCDKKGTV